MRAEQTIKKYFSKANKAELAYMAFTGQYELVHSIVRNAPINELEDIFDKDIFSQTMWE